MYVTDFNYYPADTEVDSSGVLIAYWELELIPYDGGINWATNWAYQCPSYTGPINQPMPFTSLLEAMTKDPVGSYSYVLMGSSLHDYDYGIDTNYLGIGAAGPGPYGSGAIPRRQSDIVAPSELFALMDVREYLSAQGVWASGRDWMVLRAFPRSTDLILRYSPRHNMAAFSTLDPLTDTLSRFQSSAYLTQQTPDPVGT
jgi:hypothetical protein